MKRKNAAATVDGILKRNLTNIGRKMRRGETLTASEVKFLQEQRNKGAKPAAEQRFVKSQVELANLLGVERKTIQRARQKPGAPVTASDGRLDVQAWREFLEKEGTISDGPDKSSLQAEQILIQNHRLKAKLAKERGEWIPKLVIRQVVTEFVTAAKSRTFTSSARIATIARAAVSTSEAVEDVRKELMELWKQLEGSEWYAAEPAKEPAA